MNSFDKRCLLFVLPWSPNLPGGVSVVVRNIVNELRNRKFSPIVVVNSWNARYPCVDVEGNLNFRFALFGAMSFLGIAKAIVAFPIHIITTHLFLRKHRVMAVNFHYPNIDVFGIAFLKFLRLFKGRIVLSFHGTDVQKSNSALENRLWNFIYKYVDGVTACSKALANKISEDYNININRITVIYNGVDTAVFCPTSSAESALIPLPKQYIVSIGSYILRKGHIVLLDAFSLLKESFPDLHLVIVGMDGPERQALVAHATVLGLDNRLTCFVGLKPEIVASIVARATLCVQPSFAEPFGLAVIEAGACGTPVLASAVGGHLELITDNITGFFFPAGDSDRCALAMQNLLSDMEKANNAAVLFRQEIIDTYTWDECSQSYLSLLTERSYA